MSHVLPRLLSRILFYLGLALGFLGLCGLITWCLVRTGRDLPPIRWVGFVCMTPVIFWAVLKQFRRYWRRPTMWLVTSVLLVVHIAVFSVFLTYCPDWQPVWFLLLAFPEGWAMYLILHRVMVGNLW